MKGALTVVPDVKFLRASEPSLNLLAPSGGISHKCR